MKNRKKWLGCAAIALIAGIGLSGDAQDRLDATALSADEQTVRQHAEAFVAAFNQADAEAVAALWAEDGEMSVDGETRSTGRREVEQAYSEFFAANPGVQISVHINSVRRLGPNMMIEKGVSEIMNDEADHIVDAYTLVHVRRDNQWLIATADVQQEVVDAPDWRADLAMLEGKWQASEGAWRLETEYEWVANDNFLKRTFTVIADDQVERTGVQVIGWDPMEQTITSWMFSADGGHGRAWWIRDGNQWEITAEGVTPEGEQVTATNLITILSDDSFRWQSTNRSIGGYALDNTESIRVTRVK